MDNTDKLPGRSAAVFLLVFLTVLLSGYALSTVKAFPHALLVGAALVLASALYLTSPRNGMNVGTPAQIAFLVTMSGTIAVSVMGDTSPGAVSIAATTIGMLLIGFLISLSHSLHQIVDLYLWIVRFITVVGLAVYFAVFVLGVPPPLSLFVNVNGAVYGSGLVYFLLTENGQYLPRALGVFWEPGLYASFLCLALLFRLFICRTRRLLRFDMGLFILALLTTLSTAGYILAAFTLLLASLRRVDRLGVLRIPLTLLAVIGLYFGLEPLRGFLSTTSPELFSKVESGVFEASTRWLSPSLNLELFSESPLTGWGIGGAQEAYLDRMVSLEIGAQTSTSTFFLAALGVPGIIYTVAWIVGVVRTKHLDFYGRVAMLAVMGVVLNKEPHMSVLFTYTILFSLLSSTVSKSDAEAPTGVMDGPALPPTERRLAKIRPQR